MFPAFRSSLFVIFLILLVGVFPRLIQKSLLNSSQGEKQPFLELQDWRIRFYPERNLKKFIPSPFEQEKREFSLAPRRREGVESALGAPLAPGEEKVSLTFIWKSSGDHQIPLALLGEGIYQYKGDTLLFSLLMNSQLEVIYVGTKKRVVLRNGPYRDLNKVDSFLDSFTGIPLENLKNCVPLPYPSRILFWKGLKQAILKESFRMAQAYGEYQDEQEKAAYLYNLLLEKKSLNQLTRHLNLLGVIKKASPPLKRKLLNALSEYGKEGSSWLGQALISQDFSLRKEALQVLKESKKPGLLLLPFYRRALEDKNQTVQQGVVQLLGQMGRRAFPTFPLLLEKLLQNKKDIPLTREIRISLARMGPQIIPLLEENLWGSPWKTRLSIVKIFSQMGEEALEVLLRCLGDPEREIQREALRALGNLGPRASSALPELVELLSQDSLKNDLVQTFRKIGPQALSALLGALKENNPYLRKEALWAIGRVGSGNFPGFSRLFDSLRDPHRDVRRQAIMALERLKAPLSMVLPRLIESLKDPDPLVREEVLRTLGRWEPRPTSAIPSMAILLKDKNPSVRSRASWALGRMGREALAPLIKVLKSSSIAEKEGAVIALGNLGQEGLKTLIKEMEEAQGTGKYWFILSLVERGREGINPLKKALNHRDFSTSLAAAFGLLLLQEKDLARPVLMGALKDEDEQIRAQTLFYLEKLGKAGAFALPELEKISQDLKGKNQQKIKDLIKKIKGQQN